MAGEPNRLTLYAAHRAATTLLEQFRPFTERVVIAGSVRREEATCKDVELVVISKMSLVARGLYEEMEPYSGVEEVVRRNIGNRLWGVPVKNGPKYKQIPVGRYSKGGDPFMLDLFVVSRETWAVQLAIRTGPWRFSKSLVTPRAKGGLLPDGYAVKGGYVANTKTGEVMKFDEEKDFLEFTIGRWVDPRERKDGLR